MDKKRKKSRRKVVHLLYRNKNVPPLSQMLTITSQAKKIKDLIQNNRALAFIAHEAQSEVARYKNMLQDYLKDRNQIMFAQVKVKDMAETIKKLVSNLEDISACLNLPSKDILPTLTDYIRSRSKITSLSTIQEADSSLSEEEVVTPLEDIQENSNYLEGRILNTASTSCPVNTESVENSPKQLIASNETEISVQPEKHSTTVDDATSRLSFVAGRKSKRRYSERSASEVEESAFSNIKNSGEFNEAEVLSENPKKPKRENSPLFKKPINFKTNLKVSKIPILMQSEKDQNKLTENFKKAKGKELRRETFVISTCTANAPESHITSNQGTDTSVIPHQETSKSSILDKRGTYVLSASEHNIVDRRGTYILSTVDEQSTKAVDKPVESDHSSLKTFESTVLNNTILLPEDMELTEVIPFSNSLSTKNNVIGLETSISPPSVTVGINKDNLLHDEMQSIDAAERSGDKLVSQENNSFKTRLLCENGSMPTETEHLDKVIFSDYDTAKRSLSKESVRKKSIPVKYLEECKSSELLEKPVSVSEIVEKETTVLNDICPLDPIAVTQADSAVKPRFSMQRKVRNSVALYKEESISKLLEGKDDLNYEVQNVRKAAAMRNSRCSESKKTKVSKSGILQDKKSLVESSKEEKDYSHLGSEHERENILENSISKEERTCVPETSDVGKSPVVPSGPRASKRCRAIQKYSVFFTSDSECYTSSDEEFIVKLKKVKDKKIKNILPKEEAKGENKISEMSLEKISVSDSANQRISIRNKSARKYSVFATDSEASITSDEELNKEPETSVKEKKWSILPRKQLKGKNKHKFVFKKRTSPKSSSDETQNQNSVIDDKLNSSENELYVFNFSTSSETGSSSNHGTQTHRNCHSEVSNDQETVSVSQINDIKEVKEKSLSSKQRRSKVSTSYKKSKRISRKGSCKLSAVIVTGDGSENCNTEDSSSRKDNTGVTENKPIANSQSISETNNYHKSLELTTKAVKTQKDHRSKSTHSNKSHGICTDVSKKQVEYSPETKTKKIALSKNETDDEEKDFLLKDKSQIKPENNNNKINHDLQEEEVIESPTSEFSVFNNNDVQSQKKTTFSGKKSILATRAKNTNDRKMSISTKRVSICENIRYFDEKDVLKPLSKGKPVKEASELPSYENTDDDTEASKSNSSNKFDLFQDSLDSNEKLARVAVNKMTKRSGNVKIHKSNAKDIADQDVLTTEINCISDKQVNVDETKEENNSVFCHKEQSSRDPLANIIKYLKADLPVSDKPVLIGTSFEKMCKTSGKSKTKKSNNKLKNALSHDENVCTLNLVKPEVKPALSKDANYSLKKDSETYKKEKNLLPKKKKSSSKQDVSIDLCKEDLEKNYKTAVKEKGTCSLPACIANDLDPLDQPSDTTNDMSTRRRRTRPISYKEPSIRTKLRRNLEDF